MDHLKVTKGLEAFHGSVLVPGQRPLALSCSIVNQVRALISAPGVLLKTMQHGVDSTVMSVKMFRDCIVFQRHLFAPAGLMPAQLTSHNLTASSFVMLADMRMGASV